MKYLADDGTVFDKEDQCLAYEKEYAWFTKIWNGYKDPTKNNKWVSGLVDKGDVINAKYVLDSLQKHFNISPKKPNGPLLNNSDGLQQEGPSVDDGPELLHQNPPAAGQIFGSFTQT